MSTVTSREARCDRSFVGRLGIALDSMRVVATTLCMIAGAATSSAQFVQYSDPGSLANRSIPTKEGLEKAMEEARWNLGPVRVAPWFALKNVTYNNNVFGTSDDQVSDFTATIGAGLHAYLPIGPKFVVGAVALPEYVWWNDLENLRGTYGRYGGGLFGYFNRLTVEAQVFDIEDQGYVSSEFIRPVGISETRGSANLEVRILDRLWLIGRASESRWRHDPMAEDPAGVQYLLLDRDETSVGGGLRYVWSDAFSIAIGAARLDSTFVRELRDRSNSGTTPFLEMKLNGKRWWGSATVSRPDLTAKEGSRFVSFRDTAGRAQIGWRPAGEGEIQLYGQRALSYAVSLDSQYSYNNRVGVALQGGLGWRTVGRAFWETGTYRYIAAEGSPVAAHDEDSMSYGGQASIDVGRSITLSVQVTREDYAAPAPYTDRSITRIQTGLGFGGLGAGWW
jgi:hypothetical protein